MRLIRICSILTFSVGLPSAPNESVASTKRALSKGFDASAVHGDDFNLLCTAYGADPKLLRVEKRLTWRGF
jgi:hypothetical protein